MPVQLSQSATFQRFTSVITYGLLLVLAVAIVGCKREPWQWETIETSGQPTARHEAGLIGFDQKLYLLGGRRVNPVDVFDPSTATWTELSKPPVEIHHFQPVVVDDAIVIIGAMTGGWPHETPLDRVLLYYPKQDTFKFSHSIPEHRRRGGAGAVVHNGKIYLVGGITEGHMSGSKAWLDEYDPKTGEWRVLPDAPHARDHFQAVVLDNKLYAFAGRRTSKATDQDMSLTVAHGNVFDFQTKQWLQPVQGLALPTHRAGNAVFTWGNEIIVGEGESASQLEAHNELEAYNVDTQSWRRWPSLVAGRHGTGFVVLGDYVYTASGSGNRGGGPELHSVERLKLPTVKSQPVGAEGESRLEHSEQPSQAALAVHKQWHTYTLDFEGPAVSELAESNPFLHYRLNVTFKHSDAEFVLRGYYAADGQSHLTHASEGNVWQVKFTPPHVGEWTYEAVLEYAPNIAVSGLHPTLPKVKPEQITRVPLTRPQGALTVIPSDSEGPDFKAWGHLTVKDSYFYFPAVNKYWLKAGANSPENLLAYYAFDGTYRIQTQEREGESKVNTELHRFVAHKQDWRLGDPTVVKPTTGAGGDAISEKPLGQSIYGAMNYLHSKKMNAVYFLTLNIKGDGNDVWPYATPDDFTRFDVSKLAQWEQLFEYMQTKGLLLHIVTQETENERLLDDGNLGVNRALYYQELIARFGHHPALVWNLGEENGYAEWSPPAQNTEQRKAMIDFFTAHDPYNHPLLLHTHAEPHTRDPVLEPFLGYPGLDGLSFQDADRTTAAQTIYEWKQKAKAAGKPWLITMDEIGKWDLGANTDELDPGHVSLRGDVLWGSLLSGAAGVEWYFGAHVPHNDLSSEDWRLRDELWTLTAHAIQFLEQHVAWWALQPSTHLIDGARGSYGAYIAGQSYVYYLPKIDSDVRVDLRSESSVFHVYWYNPATGGGLEAGRVSTVEGGGIVNLGKPADDMVNTKSAVDKQDWVVLLSAKALDL